MRARLFALALAWLVTSCALLTSLGDLGGASDGGPDAANDASTCAADTDNDPANCGRCNHDCQGGACEKGACQPVTLVTGQPTPYGLAVDNAYAFWGFGSGNTSGIARATKADGGSFAVITTGLFVDSLLVEGPNLYGSGGAGTSSVFVVSGADNADSSAPLTTTTFVEVVGLATDGTKLYFAGTEDFVDAGVESVPIGGGPAIRLATSAQLSAVAAGNGSVYFWNGAAIMRIPTNADGGVAATPVVTSVVALAALGFVATSEGPRVVWVGGQEGTVKIAPADGTTSTPTILATAQANPGDLALDATRVYWTNSTDGTVMACDLLGGAAPVTLASAQSSPGSIAVDATSIYWLDVNSASLMKLAK